ncbi:DNA mismatch repair endonuclease MutL [Thermotalea metallivorans]|uniref:DNA mismatch repair protein MutL n=1 Tax=Thermotalea metallivorans TaxID=520762 RepID=A0A140L8I9_9FIRM|nr:DNA mismatch repair endonuclease MutL [Thermotalea metallivorans]KXG76864.1 DNA mismatch repair protein MutL [Thermotalea metallivorans]
MINPIMRLDQLTANKIAAGEVVDRPASVVKELVENSIDAQATSIIVEIKDGGKTYIRVTDNGTGINESDIELAFERHATSKIRNIEDLDAILSLGFRGEALASISAVAQIELMTKTEEMETGVYLEVHGGKIISHKKIGTSRGTTMIVKNLFFNTPARLKFMKSQTTETGYISDILNKLAMAHPNIAMRFINNGNIVFTTPGSGNVIHNITNIYGKELGKSMYHVKKEYQHIVLEAFISKPSIHRGNRQLQAFFVNGRYVKSTLLQNCVEEAYKTLLPINKYPICFLYLWIPPESIDVNIHPAKMEIKFSNEELLKQFMIKSIKEALYRQNLIPEISFEKKEHKETLPSIPMDMPPIENADASPPAAVKEVMTSIAYHEDNLPVYTNNNGRKDLAVHRQEEQIRVPDFQHQVSPASVSASNGINPMEIRIIGQIFHTYFIGENGQHMFLIDQHAAHERILYEWMSEKFKNHAVAMQQLLVPMVIEFSFGEWSCIKENMEFFHRLGFQIEEFGQHSILIRAVPMVMGEPEAKSFFMEVVDHLGKDVEHPSDFKMDRIISMACKEAIKAKDKLDIIEINEVMKQLSRLENPFTCPHGRPIIISMSKYEIEKKFKRV